MDTSPNNLYALLYRYYHGLATAEETTELMHLISLSTHDEKLSKALKKIWDKKEIEKPILTEVEFNRMLEQIVPEEVNEPKTTKLYFLARWAALIVVLVGIGLLWKMNQTKHTKQGKLTFNEILPGSNKAVLTLADGNTIWLDSAHTGTLAQQGTSEVIKTQDGNLSYRPSSKLDGQPALSMNTITTPRGGQYHVVLPDGSEVWLNAASSIRFPAQFASNERRVTIQGEVFFDVKKDPAKPFKVQFGSSEVEVLGTRFNIMTYTDEPHMQATLLEGSVQLKHAGQTQKLRPGEQATMGQSGQIDTQYIDIEEVTAWKDGLFYFRDADMSTVMKQIGRWYDIDYRFEAKATDKHKALKRFSGKVSRNVNISQLLDMLQYIGIEYKIKGRQIIILQ